MRKTERMFIGMILTIALILSGLYGRPASSCLVFAEEEEYPDFSQSKTVNGVTVTVSTEAGVFPADAVLSVIDVPSSRTESAVEEERESDQSIAVSYTFDICVLDVSGNELQPAEGKNVHVSFCTEEVADANLDTRVYHVADDGSAEFLDVTSSGETASVQTDGFSYYTVEFTYDSLRYILPGDGEVAVSEILDTMGLEGTAEEVSVSSPELFSASAETGEWVVMSHQPFSSKEWMKVRIGDIWYEITVTDAQSGICGINGGDNLKWVLDDNGTLTISGSGEMDDYDYIGKTPPWENTRDSIINIIIKPDVASIGEHAFQDCFNLESVTIPASVTKIGEDAFYISNNVYSKLKAVYIADLGAWCGISFGDNPLANDGDLYLNNERITDLVIPDGVQSISSSAFLGCSLTSVTIPSSVTKIGEYAFGGCNSLTSVTFKEGSKLKGIDGNTFYNCESLQSVAIPDNVETIGEYAFGYCTRLKHVKLPNKLINIGDNAFNNCTDLEGDGDNGNVFKIPDSVEKIGKNAFYSCDKIGDIYVDNLRNNVDAGLDWHGNATVHWKHTVTVDVSPKAGGTVTVTEEGKTNTDNTDNTFWDVDPGTQKATVIMVTAAKGYFLEKLTYQPKGGTETDITNEKSFEMPDADVTVKAYLKKQIKIIVNDQIYDYDGNPHGESGTAYTDPAVIATKITVEGGLEQGDLITSITLDGQETNPDVYEGRIKACSCAIGTNGAHTDNYIIKYVNGDLTINALVVPKYTVTFVDGQGKTLKTQKVERGKAATAPSDPKRPGYTFTGWDKDFSKVISDMTVTAKWKKAAKKVSGTLLAKMTAKGKRSLVLTWNKVKGAEGYDIFFIKCGKESPKKVKTIKGNRTFKWTKNSLKTKEAYKAVVKAYVMKNGKKTYVRTSPMVHAYSSGGTRLYTNAKSVTVEKTNVSLEAGKTYKIKAGVTKLQKGKMLMSTGHAVKLRFISSNNNIATVSKSGKITAKSKGSCKVYVIAVNGAKKAVKVTVK